MMYCDLRIPGAEMCYFSAPPDAHMFVPDAIRKCVVFIGFRNSQDEFRLAGTGFMVAKPYNSGASLTSGSVHKSFAYLLTAKHVLDDASSRNGRGEVLVRFNYRDGKAHWVSTQLTDWRFHPTEKDTVDVALLNMSGFPFASNLDHGVYPIAGFATPQLIAQEEIGIGDETFIAGLFSPHKGNTRNIPIVRIGNIAAMPGEEKVVTALGAMDAYLIEARSIGGVSGAPVFVNLGAMRVSGGLVEVRRSANDQERRSAGTIYLLGLMHGHFKEDTKSVNMGIGIVVPAAKIMEVINQEAILSQEKQARNHEEAKNLPVMDSIPDDENQEAIFKKVDFEAALRKASRRVSPSKSDSETK